MTFRTRALALALLPLSLAAAQQPSPIQIDDPANLMGERVSPQSLADDLPINHGAPALQQLLLKLRTRASLMLIVAHPDDEDGGMLTYESRGHGVRVADLSLTRGEGGQNLMSADFNDALGLIRTQELLAADRYFGVDQFFGTEVDFGFSKTKEEAFAQWTHDRVLYDAVRAVRLYRPLVLASVFVGGPTDGHGHHQVSGEICQEVFLAAADPKVFPEMRLPPWAPLKVYARVPFSRVTPDGMFDYATGKTIPTRFHNYVTGQDSTSEPVATVQIHEGERSTALGMDGDTYVQFARKGLALQKTQIGPGVRLAPAGAYDSGYTLIASRVGCSKPTTIGCPILDAASSRQGGVSRESATASKPKSEQSLFEGIDTSLPSIADLAPSAPPTLRATLQAIDQDIAEAQRLFDPAHPDLTATPLRQALILLDPLVKQYAAYVSDTSIEHELKIKRVQLNNALILAIGVEYRVTMPKHSVFTSDRSAELTETFINHGSRPIRVGGHSGTAGLATQDFTRNFLQPMTFDQQFIAPGGSRTYAFRINFDGPLNPTRPYFSRKSLEQPFYDISNEELRNAPETPAPFALFADVEDGVDLQLTATASAGKPPESIQPVSIVPPVTVNLTRTFGVPPFKSQADLAENRKAQTASSNGILPLTTKTFQLGALLGVEATEDSILGPARIGPDEIPVKLLAPPAWQIASPTYNQYMEPVLEHFTLRPSALSPNQTYLITGEAVFANHTYKESFLPVGYPGLTSTNYYTPATYRATAVDVKVAPNLRIAYLPGTGDTVPNFLPDLGIHPTILAVADLTPATLANFDAILLGVRAYSAHPELVGPGSKPLLDYAAAGGVVVVQYNSGGPSGQAAPYPFDLPGDSAHNVVEEADPVTFLAPTSPILNYPNKLIPSDFTGWIEEWGHGFASTWDHHYTPILEVHDPGQEPQKGGLLLARTGKGAYIYCALALYRQLPEGVPGAYRLLANLLSYAKSSTP